MCTTLKINEIEDDFVDRPAFVSLKDLQKEIWGNAADSVRNQEGQTLQVQSIKSLDLEKHKEQEEKLKRYRELAAKRNRKKCQIEKESRSLECQKSTSLNSLKNGLEGLQQPSNSVPEIEQIKIKEEVCTDTMEIEIEPSQIYECQEDSESKKSYRPIAPASKYQCPHCPYWTERMNVLEIHKKIHNKSKTRAITLLNCEKCKFKTIYSKEFDRHMSKYHPRSANGRKKGCIPCDQCKYKAISNNDLMLHKSSEHNVKTALLKCPHCSFKTDLMTSLSSHLLCHDKDGTTDQTRFQCDMCIFQSKSLQGLSRHRKIHLNGHELCEVYACDECDFTSMHKTSLQYHKMTHVDIHESFLYKCDQCPHQTKFKWGLNAHKKTHLKAEERPTYACEECEYETFYKGNLKTHYEVVHRGIRISRNTKCEQCGFVTRYKKKMREHVKKVHGDNEALVIKSEDLAVFENDSGQDS